MKQGGRLMVLPIFIKSRLWVLALLACFVTYGIFGRNSGDALEGASGRHLLSSPDQSRTFTDSPARTISSYILSVVFGAIATACGIGGGPFFVPLFTYDLGFSVKGAAALSQVVIAAGALSGVALILHKKSPLDDSKPLINYDLVLLMLPALLLGVSLGVLSNKALPSWLITMLLLVLLVWLTEKMFVKAFKVHRSEKERDAYKHKQEEEGQDAAQGEEDGGQATHVRKVASAPDELDKLKARSMHGGIMQGEQDPTLQEGGPLALPPSANAALEAIKESHGEDSHVEREDAKISGEPDWATQSPFGAVNFSEQIHGGTNSGAPAGADAHQAASCSSREQSEDEQVGGPTAGESFAGRKGGSSKLPELQQPLRKSSSLRRAHSSSLKRMFSRPRLPGAGMLGKSASMRNAHVALGLQLSMRRAVSVTLGEPQRDVANRGRRLETFVSYGYLPYFDTRPFDEILAESEGRRVGEMAVTPGRQLPMWAQGALLAAFWAVFLALQVLLSLFSFCSPVHWPVYAVLIVVCCAFEALHIYLVRRSHEDDRGGSADDAEAQGDEKKGMHWTIWALTKLAAITLVCGFIAGLFGIGGGVVLGPLMLSFGTHAKISAATSNLMVLFSSSAAAIVYGLAGDLNLQISLIFGLSCAVASLVGVFLISRLIDRSGKASIIVFLLSGIIAIGALMTGILGLKQAILDLMHGDHIGFSGLCGSDKA